MKALCVMLIFALASACATQPPSLTSQQRDIADRIAKIEAIQVKINHMEQLDAIEWKTDRFQQLRQWIPYSAKDILPSNLVTTTMPTEEEYRLLLVWADRRMTTIREEITLMTANFPRPLIDAAELDLKAGLDLFLEFNQGKMSWGDLSHRRLKDAETSKVRMQQAAAQVKRMADTFRATNAAKEREERAANAAKLREEQERLERQAAADRQQRQRAIDGLLSGLSAVAEVALISLVVVAGVAAATTPRTVYYPPASVTCFTQGPWSTCR